MLSSRRPRRSWAYDARHQDGYSSMFRVLADHWRPVAAALREADGAGDVRARYKQDTPRTSPLPTCWSPWLFVK